MTSLSGIGAGGASSSSDQNDALDTSVGKHLELREPLLRGTLRWLGAGWALGRWRASRVGPGTITPTEDGVARP